MDPQYLTVPCRITPQMIWEFALFDAFTRRKYHRRPLVFALIMLASAAGCFLLRERTVLAVWVGVVFLVLGVCLPGVYLLTYLFSSLGQARRRKGREEEIAYTVRLTETGIVATAGSDRVERPWGELLGAYRLKRSVCLYVAEEKAYLLPASDRPEHEARLWDLITDHLGAEKCRDRRNKKD